LEKINQRTMKVEELAQIFENNSNCYADCDEVILAMDKPRFVKVVSEIIQKDDWISVKDRLPEPGVNCLTYWQIKYPAVTEKYIDVSEVITKCGTRRTSITHWKPLPDPPKDL
jgi:hypothetical protein